MILTISDARRTLGWDMSRDGELADWIGTVEGSLDRLTDRKFAWAQNEDTVVTFEQGSKYFRLERYPLTAIKIAEWPLDDAEPNMETIAAGDCLISGSDYDVRLTTGAVVLRRCIHRIKIRASGGFTRETFPAELKSGLLAEIKYLVSREAGAAISVSSASNKEGGVTFMDKSEHQRRFLDMIEMYRRR